MQFKVVIPARLGSSRLPNKPLKMIADKPMIQWVVEAAQRSSAEQVVVATDHQSIVDAVKAFGGEACMTRSDHESGTDRIQEIAAFYQWPDDTIVVNVQGDEPLIPPAVIDQVAENLHSSPEASVATLSEPVTSVDQVFNPNAVKVVKNHLSMALYFSRAPIPYARDQYAQSLKKLPEPGLVQRHIGIYAYRVSLLHAFITWPVAPLEACERLEQLRVLANGHAIHVASACEYVPGGVDTEEDLQRVAELLEKQK